ncbi:MAG: hypothetical protein GF334_11215 [Candidatus Altiarchaeales archaeon]|nr:hypothetical protein [Candidatus Altiarchaeales archaeon]
MQITQKTCFHAFEKAREKGPEKVIEHIKGCGLNGRGGAGFPTGLKWEFTRKSPGSNKVLVCNADEGEPGTFKDKYILEHNPETLVEGMAIAAYAIGAQKAYIYLRGEYGILKEDLMNVIADCRDMLSAVELDIEIVLGAGAYICGDETAIMNSIEELRGEPRTKPPYPAEKGVYGLPTCVNNVETLTNVPLTFQEGWRDLRLYSLSGNVSKAGVYELPPGVACGRLIKLGKPKKELKALFFGAAGGCIPYDPETRLSKHELEVKGAMLGSCTVIAVDEKQSIPRVCRQIARFFVHECCGRCTPCREGNYRMLRILDRVVSGKASEDDLSLLEDIAKLIDKTSFCGLGQSSDNHIQTALTYFRGEFTR